MRRRAPLVVLGTTLLAMVTGTTAYAQFGGALGGIIKVAGIGYAVKVFGPQINKFLNTILLEHNVGGMPATKVVPILRIGSGTYVGAAQVTGRPDLVSRTQGVAEGELNISRVQLRYLIPINSLNILKTLPRRTNGVGVSAIIDLHV